MGEVWGSIVEYFKSRMRTPVYGVFTFWWMILHWEFIYALLFVSQADILKHTGYLKNEYLKRYFTNYLDSGFWWWSAISFLIAGFMTYLMVWIIPRLVLNRAFERQQKDNAAKRKIKLKYAQEIQVEKTKLEEEKTKLETQTGKKLAATARKAAQAKKIVDLDPEILWQTEYEEFKKSQLFKKFDRLITALYRHNGQTVIEDTRYPVGRAERVQFVLNPDLLAYADTSGLINYDRSNKIISLTDKGKFFVKQFQGHKT